jgi:Zn-finger protein
MVEPGIGKLVTEISVHQSGLETINTEKYSGKIFPCGKCGLDKIRQLANGYVAKYCEDCRSLIKKENMIKAQQKRSIRAHFEGTDEIQMPDSSIIRVRAPERLFIENRLRVYKQDFDWTESSDYGLLTKLILLELQTNRINELMTIGHKQGNAMSLAKLTEEYRKCQAELGITRTKRLDRRETEDAPAIVRKMIVRFKEYKEKHPERFAWKCEHCKKINYPNLQNNIAVKEETPDANK